MFSIDFFFYRLATFLPATSGHINFIFLIIPSTKCGRQERFPGVQSRIRLNFFARSLPVKISIPGRNISVFFGRAFTHNGFVNEYLYNIFSFYGCRHSGDGPKYSKQRIEFTSPAWLHSSGWDHSMPTVLIVHGYGGASKDYLPGAVLRDGKRTTGARLPPVRSLGDGRLKPQTTH